jgi:hypothetical protein
MRNRKNIPEKKTSKQNTSMVNRSASFKSLRNDFKKPVSTFGVIKYSAHNYKIDN